MLIYIIIRFGRILIVLPRTGLVQIYLQLIQGEFQMLLIYFKIIIQLLNLEIIQLIKQQMIKIADRVEELYTLQELLSIVYTQEYLLLPLTTNTTKCATTLHHGEFCQAAFFAVLKSKYLYCLFLYSRLFLQILTFTYYHYQNHSNLQ